MSKDRMTGSDSRHAWRARDFANAHGMGMTKLYAEIKAGRLKAHKLGKLTLILDDDGRAWRENLPAFKIGEAA